MFQLHSPPPESPLRLQAVGAAIRLVMKERPAYSPNPDQKTFCPSDISFERHDRDIADIFSVFK